ncbi:MAG: DUF2147 domain-containing protein [Bacteroidota bacterium]
MKYILTIAVCLCAAAVNAQSIVGKWKTIDDESGKERSVVEIFKKGDRYYGKIVELFRDPGEDPNPMCEKCEGDKKDQPIVGMEIISGLRQKGKDFKDGDILDPENGKTYDCKIWVEDGNLKVRGYLYFFYRTQTWLPAGE